MLRAYSMREMARLECYFIVYMSLALAMTAKIPKFPFLGWAQPTKIPNEGENPQSSNFQWYTLFVPIPASRKRMTLRKNYWIGKRQSWYFKRIESLLLAQMTNY